MCSSESQQHKELNYLRHLILNGTSNIAGMLRQMENQIKLMTEAINTYEEKWSDSSK